jgi:DNA polymerase-3 subunit delta'
MNSKPLETKKLFGMSHYFNEIINLYNNNKMPNKILISGKKGLGKSTLAYHIINYIFSLNEDHKYNIDQFQIDGENRSYKLLKNQSHPNFYLIDLLDEKKSIDVAQIRQMITYANKSSFNNMSRFILIDNVENLNNNSVNALLKIIEEPNEGIFFILINNNEKKILPTLKSRCMIFKIFFTFDQSINIASQLVGKDVFEIINYELINHYISPGEIINLINFANTKKINLLDYNLFDLLSLLIDNTYYKKNKNVKKIIINLIEVFFLKKYQLSKKKISFYIFYQNFLNKISYTEKFNLDEDSLFLEFKSKLLNE